MRLFNLLTCLFFPAIACAGDFGNTHNVNHKDLYSLDTSNFKNGTQGSLSGFTYNGDEVEIVVVSCPPTTTSTSVQYNVYIYGSAGSAGGLNCDVVTTKITSYSKINNKCVASIKSSSKNQNCQSWGGGGACGNSGCGGNGAGGGR